MLSGITLLCFTASYAIAFALEMVQLLRPRAVIRLLSTLFGAGGLLAHTLFLMHAFVLAETRRPPTSQFGSVLFVAWVLAVFYIYGSLHHRRVAWGVFVLPLVEGLIALAWSQKTTLDSDQPQLLEVVHATLLTLAAVGVCVGFLASVMYLVQAHRLKTKSLPGQGVPLLSLERLEEMNRRAIILAFPLLTAGLLTGIALMFRQTGPLAWTDPRIVASGVLWVVFALLIYLRYGYHLRGRRVAILTIAAFCLLLFTLAWPHLGPGGGP